MAKPTQDYDWATASITDPVSGQDNKLEPSGTKKTNGWVFLEKPPFNWFNYWMNAVGLYLNYIIDEALEGVFTFTGNKTFSNDVEIDGTSQLDGNIETNGNITTAIINTDTTASTSKDTGAIITEGGIGVEKKVFAGEGFGAIYRDSTGTETTVGLHYKIIEIGDWNMNWSGSGVQNLSLAHALSDHKKVRSFNVIIRGDSDIDYYEFISYNVGGATYINANNVVMNQGASSNFDSISYDSTSYNRGWIYITYED